MKYKVINGFYDADKRRIIEKDEKIELDDSKAKALIAKGLVAKMAKKDQKAEEEAAKKAEEEAAKKAEEETKKAEQ